MCWTFRQRLYCRVYAHLGSSNANHIFSLENCGRCLVELTGRTLLRIAFSSRAFPFLLFVPCSSLLSSPLFSPLLSSSLSSPQRLAQHCALGRFMTVAADGSRKPKGWAIIRCFHELIKIPGRIGNRLASQFPILSCATYHHENYIFALKNGGGCLVELTGTTLHRIVFSPRPFPSLQIVRSSSLLSSPLLSNPLLLPAQSLI